MPIPDPTPKRMVASPHAWARFRKVMRWMTGLALLCVGATLAYLRIATGGLPLHMAIAASIGVFLTVIVGTGLMTLVFLSAGSGHDDTVDDPFDERRRP